MNEKKLISIDTNILRSDPYFNKGQMSNFKKLCKKENVKLVISEIVLQEYRTDQIKEITEKIDETMVRIDTKIKKSGQTEEKKCLLDSISNLEKAEKQYIDSIDKRLEVFLEETDCEIVEIKDNHGKKVMDDYFLGNTVFKSIKNRKDIPDAYIFYSFKDFVDLKLYESYYFITNDEKMYECFNMIGVKCFKSIEEFINDENIQNEIRQFEMKEKLRFYIEKNISNQDENIKKELEENIESDLIYYEVIDDNIPDDNNIGTITGILGIDEIYLDYENIEILNYEKINIKFECDADALIQYYIFKADYYCLSDEDQKNISIVDHNDHYYEAEENVIIRIEGQLSLELDDYSDLKDEEEIFEEYEVKIEQIESTWIKTDI